MTDGVGRQDSPSAVSGDGSETPSRQRALVVDYGGVLTTSVGETFRAWSAADGLDAAEAQAVMWEMFGGEPATNPTHALERGELDQHEFERQLARRLRRADGGEVVAAGLLNRIFAGMRIEPRMVAAVRRARQAGLRTALLSNSWGLDYDRADWETIFETVVISGEVGLRKPEPAIYALAAERLELPPGACVFVDDLAVNVRGAAAAGMIGVHHTDVDQTLEELEILLGVPFTDA